MAFDIRDVVATETAMTIKGFAGEQMWEVGFAYVAIDKEGDVFKSVLKYLDITI